MKTSIEYWAASADRYNQSFRYRDTEYCFCSFAEGMGRQIIGFIVFNSETQKHEMWQGKKRERLIEVKP